MTMTMRWRVYDANGALLAACVEPDIAAAVVALGGAGATIRVSRRTVWTEGAEEDLAGNSYDRCADVCLERAR